MDTLLQRLLIETTPKTQKNLVLRSFIDTVLPAMERVFALTPALGGSKVSFAKKADQSLVVHVLNGLLTAWNLSQQLPEPLSEEEQRSLCLGFTLHDYDKYVSGQNQEIPDASQTTAIRELCQKLGELLNFKDFWSEWKNYLLDICFLAQNTQAKKGSHLNSRNWESDEYTFKIAYPERILICELLRFGDIAVHMNDPAEVSICTDKGKQLQKCLDNLGISKGLVYHRLRDCRGLLTNQTHNAVIKLTKKQQWEPILYFAQGVVYLAPQNPKAPMLLDIQEFVWHSILNGEPSINQEGLADYFRNGEVGFIRSGKGLKIAPLTRELFTPAELIRQLSSVVIKNVKNIKDPATPKRLQSLSLSNSEREFLERGSDVWADRLAEFILLVQREFFESVEKRELYINWVLQDLDLQDKITSEKTQVQSGGVFYGWYQVAAHFMAILPMDIDRHPDSEKIKEWLANFSDRLATWAEESHLLPEHSHATREDFFSYLAQYLELSLWEGSTIKFQDELLAYSRAKSANQPICAFGSLDFLAEDQLDSVVLFKPQQYSNKNSLGGRRIKRGISKIWSLEMLLRQAYWKAPAGKLEDQQPIFLYIFPAYVHSPQTACAVGVLVNLLQRTNLWDVRDKWREADLKCSALQSLPWQGKDPKPGRYGNDYSTVDLPFMAMHYTRPINGNTVTDAWIEPAFLALALPMLLGVKVVATSSSDPLYASDKEFLETTKLDGPAGFWNLLGLPSSLRLDELEKALERLLIAYTIHLECAGAPPDPRWRSFPNTVREMTTNVLNIFRLADSHYAQRYWHYAQLWSQGDLTMQQQLKLIESLTQQYREFYQVSHQRFFSGKSSSHELLLPLSTALDVILKNPVGVHPEDVVLQGSGQLFDVIERKRRQGDENVYRPLRTQSNKELEAIRSFMETCVYQLLGNPETKEGFCKGDRALLQENRNRIKSGAEFAYRWLTLQDKQTQAEPDQTETET